MSASIPIDYRWLGVPQPDRSPVKHFLATAILLLGVACASDRAPKPLTLPSDVRGPFRPDSLTLPRLAVNGVTYHDGLQSEEVKTLSYAYNRKIVGLCGAPDAPTENGDWWMVTCGGGYLWHQDGRLWLSKNGSNVLYEVTGKHKSDRTRRVMRSFRNEFSGEPAAGGNAE